MKTINLLSVIFTISVLNAANIPATRLDGLTVHEWGTFTSVAGEDGSAVLWNALGCKSDLPRFVDDFGYGASSWGFQARFAWKHRLVLL
jgi:hypothetical protein